jgi:hypothetical protein
MSDSHTAMQKQEERALAAPVGDDGWSHAAAEAAERSIRGTLLKFADWRWTAGKEQRRFRTARDWWQSPLPHVG